VTSSIPKQLKLNESVSLVNRQTPIWST